RPRALTVRSSDSTVVGITRPVCRVRVCHLRRVTAMAQRATSIHYERKEPDGKALERAFADIRTRLGVRLEFPETALAEAQAAVDDPAVPQRGEPAVPVIPLHPPRPL